MRAIGTVAAQEEDEALRRRRAELASLRRDCELLAEACRECASVVNGGLRKAGYNPNEPRVPAGNPDGGQWTREGGGAHSTASSPVLSDASADNHWIPGAQYAANDTPSIGYNQGPPLEAPPEIPEEEPPTAKIRNAFLRAAARWLSQSRSGSDIRRTSRRLSPGVASRRWGAHLFALYRCLFSAAEDLGRASTGCVEPTTRIRYPSSSGAVIGSPRRISARLSRWRRKPAAYLDIQTLADHRVVRDEKRRLRYALAKRLPERQGFG